MTEITTKIDICEIDGTETQISRPKLRIENHWQRTDLVKLIMPDTQVNSISVSVDDLRQALNALKTQ